ASMRSLAAAVALVIVAAGYFAYQARIERAAPPRPAPGFSAARPTVLPVLPPTARDIIDRSVALDLRSERIVRMRVLDQVWKSEMSGLEAMIHDAEREFSVFATEAQGKGGASLPEIQRRSAEFRQLGAELRQQRQQHSEAALRILADWQRERLAEAKRPLVGRRIHESSQH